MGSPVSIAFHSFIKIDRRKEDPVYLQLVYQFINAVRMSLLEDGDQLPGSRKIAEDLQLHRKTVVAALPSPSEKTSSWTILFRNSPETCISPMELPITP